MIFEDLLIAFSISTVSVFAIGLIVGVDLATIEACCKGSEQPPPKQSGNILLVLFGAIVLLGGVGSVLTSIISGPAQGISHITRRTASEVDLAAAAKILMATARDTVGDCDGDGLIEPVAWRDPDGAPAPAGGGHMPASSVAATADRWGRPIGLCVWDHGSATVTDDVPECGGASASRRKGGNTISEYALALISAGQDGIFATTCHDFTDGNADGTADQPLVQTAPGADDIVLALTYGEAFAAGEGGTTGAIESQPDEACTPQTTGLLRDEMGTVQVCTSAGWEEVGAAMAGSGNFTPTTGAELGSSPVSNEISFSGFFGTRAATADGGAIIVVNGDEVGPTAEIAAGDLVSLKATAASTPATATTITLQVGALVREWTITTRAPYPAQLTLTPPHAANMNVTGPGSPAYGSPVVFTLENTGETPTAHIEAATLSSTANFEFHVGGGHLGDNCHGRSLNSGATCQIAVRPKAAAAGSYTGTLTVSDGATSDEATLSGTTTEWSCTLDDVTVSHGDSATFYSAEEHADCASVSQERICSNGNFGGSSSYQYASCEAPSNPLCSQPLVIGCIADDGSYYAGLSPDGNVPMYVAAADEGSTMQWGSRGTSRGTTSNVTGQSNTATLAGFGQAAHPPAHACANKDAHGHQDWYLPALDELNLLWVMVDSHGVTAGLDTSGSWYWSSTESTSSYVRIQRFYDGYQGDVPKDNGDYLVRCVRR